MPPGHPASPQYRDGRRQRVDASSEAEPQVSAQAARGVPRADGKGLPESRRSSDVRREDFADRMLREADLGPQMRDLPTARDTVRNVDRAELDVRKLSEYAMNPGHSQNNGKFRAWAALGYEVGNAAARFEDAQELRELIGRHMLPDGKVAAVKETADGTDYRVLNGFIGPNDRRATLVTCWRVSPDELAGPRLLTSWLAIHRDDRP